MFDIFGDDDDGAENPGDAPEADLVPEVNDPAERVRIDGPKVRDYSKVDAGPELQKEFWAQVLLFNVALFAFCLGVMLIAFQRRWTFGGMLVAVGILAFVRGYRRYHDFQKD